MNKTLIYILIGGAILWFVFGRQKSATMTQPAGARIATTPPPKKKKKKSGLKKILSGVGKAAKVLNVPGSQFLKDRESLSLNGDSHNNWNPYG